MFKSILITLCFIPLFAHTHQDQPKVQIALLLDTSNSMDGLINQAKTQLWTIVNDLATAKRQGLVPRLEVGLYEYGKSSLSSQSGYIRQVLELSSDLDRVSEALFALTTNGGDEYCAQVISAACSQLQWSRDTRDYKAIFIAGNEPFNQGQADFRTACRNAIAHGIIINTIHCGSFQEGVQTFWKEGADLADGKYACINQDQVPVAVATPFDDKILALNKELNQTYLAYGRKAEVALERQREQDENAAAAAPASAVQRTVSKASTHYRNDDWDLVDAVASGSVDLENIEEETLPEPLQSKTKAEIKQTVEEMTKKRAEVQSQLNGLAKKRDEYVAAHATTSKDESLESALIKTVRSQMAQKDFVWDK